MGNETTRIISKWTTKSGLKVQLAVDDSEDFSPEQESRLWRDFFVSLSGALPEPINSLGMNQKRG